MVFLLHGRNEHVWPRVQVGLVEMVGQTVKIPTLSMRTMVSFFGSVDQSYEMSALYILTRQVVISNLIRVGAW